MKNLTFVNSSQVRKIQGTNNTNSIGQIIFKKDNGEVLGKIETNAASEIGAEHTLNADEEIIGIYGWYDTSFFRGIGFIVWMPPRF